MRALHRVAGVGLSLVVVLTALTNVADANPWPDSGIRALERAMRVWRAARSWRLEFTTADGRHARVVFEKPHAFSIDDDRTGVRRRGILIGSVLYQPVGNHWTRSEGLTLPSEFGQSTGDDVLERGHTFAVASDRIEGLPAMRYFMRNPDVPGGIMRVWISIADGRMRRFETVAANGATTRLRIFDYDSPKNHLVPPASVESTGSQH